MLTYAMGRVSVVLQDLNLFNDTLILYTSDPWRRPWAHHPRRAKSSS